MFALIAARNGSFHRFPRLAPQEMPCSEGKFSSKRQHHLARTV